MFQAERRLQVCQILQTAFRRSARTPACRVHTRVNASQDPDAAEKWGLPPISLRTMLTLRDTHERNGLAVPIFQPRLWTPLASRVRSLIEPIALTFARESQ